MMIPNIPDGWHLFALRKRPDGWYEAILATDDPRSEFSDIIAHHVNDPWKALDVAIAQCRKETAQ